MTIKTFKNIPRTLPIVLCLLSVMLCLGYASLRPNLPPWWRQSGGGVPYVIFWILLWFALLPNRKYVWPICIGVTLFTVLLEFLQLWKYAPLESFRQTTFGAAWLGSQFSWADIPPYFLGAAAGILLLRLMLHLTEK